MVTNCEGTHVRENNMNSKSYVTFISLCLRKSSQDGLYMVDFGLFSLSLHSHVT